MSHSRSGLAWARCSSRKRAGSDTGCDGHRRGSFVVVPFEMDLAVLSKDPAGTVASCGDTLTAIRYTTLKDATTRLLQPPVFSSVSESVWEKGLPYTCKSVVCSYFSVFPDSVKVTLNACVSSVLSMYWVSATPWLWVLSVIVVPGAPSATTQTPRGMQNVS